MKRTFQPKKLKRLRKFGFMARNSNKKGSKGKAVLQRRRAKGRKRLSASEEFTAKRKKPTARIR